MFVVGQSPVTAGLPFNGIPVILVITWITTHLPTAEVWKAELAEPRRQLKPL